MRNERVSEMTTLAMFIAIVLVMGLVPYVGFIPIFGTTVTTLHVPVMIGAIYGGKRFGGPKFGLSIGFAFGAISLARSFLPFFPLDALFQNPIVAIIPRVLFGGLTWYIYVAVVKFFKEKHWVWPVIFALGTLAHTVLVLTTILLTLGFYRELLGELAGFLIVILPVNGAFEIAVAAFLGTALMIRLASYTDSTIEE